MGAPQIPQNDEKAGASALLDMLHASWMAQALRTAAELRLADLMRAGSRSVAELARDTGANEGALRRMLHALCSIGVCHEPDAGVFAVSDLGAALAEDHPGSIRSWVLWWGGPMWSTWRLLPLSVKTGRSARAEELGTSGFDHLDDDPHAAQTFHRALVELTRLAAPGILRACDLSSARLVVDVGGGYGELLRTILNAHGHVRGVLLDREHAIAGARAHLAGLLDRCELVAGDFFRSIPRGGDAYLLKTVLHDWDDEHALRLLRVCKDAMGPGARLLIIDRLMPERLDATLEHRALARSDLSMLIAHGAPERTRPQFERLLDAAGFVVRRVVPAGGPLWLVEATPAA